MKDREDILAHVEDIWRKTEERGIVRNSPFLSERERGLFLEKIKRERGGTTGLFLLPKLYGGRGVQGASFGRQSCGAFGNSGKAEKIFRRIVP